MNLKVNGEVRVLIPIQSPPNLTAVVKALGHQPQLVVVELNGVIITPTEWDKQEVKDGDNIEIVTVVGGGN